MKDFLKAAFHTSALSYVIFFAADLMRPGFVSQVFSVHWFLLVAIVSGAMWALTDDRNGQERFFGRAWRIAWQVIFGVLLALMVWQHTQAVGDLRIFVTLVGLLVPSIVIYLLTYER